ncbi:Hydrogenase maturation factor HypB [bioreactor metagenome]|uniref:Hydrogenase maturation factor HypB n=1 Tax=bioreactor metagenome TaxID=1076179 RepID=A0A645E3I0_9ZZZZ
MTDEIRLIDVKESILSENADQADVIRTRLKDSGTFLLNLMASPGAGKTSVIVQTIRRLHEKLSIAVVEGDIESIVDSKKVQAEGVDAVQIRTGGACHLDAPMLTAALDTLDLAKIDLLFVENIGNLICPAEFDLGANLQVMILSVPEGDDKILKYPLMFSVCDVLIVNKVDYLDDSDFDLELLSRRAHELNPKIKIFSVSCKKGIGLDEWSQWLYQSIQTAKGN